MIEVANVRKSYGFEENRTLAVNDVSLTIDDGDFVVILGASGSGKSTLMNLISGLEMPDDGAILYEQVDITKLSDKKLTAFRKDMVGFIFQQYYLLPHLNVEKNVKLGASLAGNQDFQQIIEGVGLKEKAKKFPYQLSGGEQQRVAIARALAKKPKVLFLDEPTGALDEETGRQVLDYLVKLQQTHQFAMVMVTHNPHIADMAKRVIRMNSGKIVESQVNATQKSAYEIGW